MQAQKNENEIEKIDVNFKQATVDNLPVNYYDVRKAPFVLTGFPCRTGEDDSFHRLPLEWTEEQVNAGALTLSKHTSGGAVLFRTNSEYLAFKSDPVTGSHMHHMPPTGVSGFDVYERLPGHKERYITNVCTSEAGAIARLGKTGLMRDFIVFMPLYAPVNTFEIGVSPDAKFEAPTPQRNATKPIVFYGSSITQGGCCSRPANNYTTMLCREFDMPQINLGFSGCAIGETAVAEYIASLDMSMFVLDYVHNAPTKEHLAKTHEPFFKIIREKHPDLPILILSSPNMLRSLYFGNIAKQTYDNAIARGDKNVYYIAMETELGEKMLRYGTIDGTHPNDLGFYWMYQICLPVMKQALAIEN